METQLVVPAGQASSQNATRDGGYPGRWRTMATQRVVPAGQASRDSGDSHPTVVNIELRQAWDGAWYPLVAQEGEPSFASHYVDSAQYFWELAASRTRKALIIYPPSGTTERAIELGNAPLEPSGQLNLASGQSNLASWQSYLASEQSNFLHTPLEELPPSPYTSTPQATFPPTAPPTFNNTPNILPPPIGSHSGGSHLAVEPTVDAEHDREEMRWKREKLRKALEARKN